MNNDLLRTWLGRISRAEAVQQDRHKDWEAALDLYNCEYFRKIYGGYDTERVDVNFANWYVDLLVALTYFRDPFIFVKGRHSRYSGFAETMETVVNYWWVELKLKQEIKRAIKSSFLMPPGWVKLGYTAKVGEDVAKIEEIQQKSIIQDIKEAITGVFKKETRPEDKGILNLNIKEESLFTTWIPSWNVVMPEGYHLIDRMPWICEIEDITMVDFYSNPLYKNKDFAKPTRTTNEVSQGKVLNKVPYTRTGASGLTQDDTSMIRLYHIWDRRENTRYTISSQADHFEGEWPYDMEGFPYKPLIFEESIPAKEKSNPYPVNAITPILPQILEQANSRTMMVKHRKRAAAYILVQKGLLTEEEYAQLCEAENMQVVLVSNIAAVQSGPMPALPPDIYKIDEVILRDLQMATNMGQMMFMPLPGTRTATQAQLAQTGLQLKAAARVDVVEDFTVGIARSLAQLSWQFLTREQVSEIIGEPVTEEMWPELPTDKKERQRIIQAELQLKIDAGSTAPPKDETVDRKQLLDFASIVVSIAPERIKKDEFVKQLTKKFKFVKDVDKIVISNDEGEIQAAQEENKLLFGNVPQVVSPNENHEIHIQQHAQILGKSDAGDIHISEHGKFMGMGEEKPQKGDMRPPMKSTSPEKVRETSPTQGKIYQGVQNRGAVGEGGV